MSDNMIKVRSGLLQAVRAPESAVVVKGGKRMEPSIRR